MSPTLGNPQNGDMASALATLNVTKKSKLPNDVCSNAKQLVILLRDVSTSMAGSKIDELNLASQALLAELSDPINKDGFMISVADFNNGSNVVISCEMASQINLPQAVASGGTNFDAPLKDAIREIEKIKAQPNDKGWRYLRPVVLFLSDGQAHATDKNIQALHELADVVSIAYGADADVDTLKRIASNGDVHVVGTRGGELRQFLEQVGKTMTDTMMQAK